MKNSQLIERYEEALKIAQAVDKLQCQVLQIQAKIELLKDERYNVTTTDVVWVEYFLQQNSFDSMIDNQWSYIAKVYGVNANDADEVEAFMKSDNPQQFKDKFQEEYRVYQNLKNQRDGKFDLMIMERSLRNLERDCVVDAMVGACGTLHGIVTSAQMTNEKSISLRLCDESEVVIDLPEEDCPDTCPCCGAQATVHQTYAQNYVDRPDGQPLYFVECTNEECSTSSGVWESPQLAVAAWNKRV